MKRDPVEKTEKFQDIMKKIQPQLDVPNEQLDKQVYGMGRCRIYWSHKKDLLEKHGIDWETSLECNPYAMFD